MISVSNYPAYNQKKDSKIPEKSPKRNAKRFLMKNFSEESGKKLEN
jgi:hypothetical protein